MASSSQEVLHHLERLACEFGSRTIGSSGNHRAAEYIAGVFQESGLTVEFQDFPCLDWQEELTSLELGGEALEAFANTFSPACEVTAPTVPFGTLEELESAAIQGMILVFYGTLAQNELAAKSAIYVSGRDRRIIQLLEERHPAGLITVNPSLHGTWRLIEDFELEIPSVTVTARSGLKLLEREGENVHMRIAAQQVPSHSANLIGRLPGDRPERIVFCAHYDTKVDTPGAYDNAAGVAVLMTLAQRLGKMGHRYSLEFVAFSGEEIYGLGDMEYARRSQDGFGRIAAAINMDGVGPRLAANSVAVFAASKAFEDLVIRSKTAYPGVVMVDPWPASDHYIFYSNGVPSVALSSVGIKDIYHTPFDTIDWISPEKLAEAVSFAQALHEAFDGAEAGTFRERENRSC